jgi:hypothetical protein
MNNIYEFLFCPQHGVFAPSNWFALLPMWNYVRDTVVALWLNYHHNNLIKRGVL